MRSASKRLTCDTYLAEWPPSSKSLAKNTYRSYESHIRLYLRPYLGHIPVEELRIADISDMFDLIEEFNPRIDEMRASKDPATRLKARYRRPVGVTSMYRILATLRKALNDLIRTELITFNLAKHVELPSANLPKPLVWTDA